MNKSVENGQDMMNKIADALGTADRMPASRELSLAKTKMEEAIMWGNRAIANLQEPVNEARENPNVRKLELVSSEDKVESDDWKKETGYACLKCGSKHIRSRCVESSCGGFDDYKFKCDSCDHIWWCESADA